MNPLLLLASFPPLRRAAEGRIISRVRPVFRSGLHITLEGRETGLRLDLCPHPGVVVLLRDEPPRVRGGRGAWIAIAGFADRILSGRKVVGVGLSVSPLAFVVETEGSGRIGLAWDRGQGRIVVEEPGAGHRTLPEGKQVLPPADRMLPGIEGLGETVERWAEGVAAGGVPAAAEDLRCLIPALSRRQSAALAAMAAEGPHRLEELFRRWRGGSSRHLTQAAAVWYAWQCGQQRLEHRRSRLARALGREETRLRRAMQAVLREEKKARDPGELRRQADALLAAGPALGRRSDPLVWEVPDPLGGGGKMRIPIEHPGATVFQGAEKLYRRARKQERGVRIRARRLAELEKRQLALASLGESLAQARTEEDVETCAESAERLGLALRDDPGEGSPPRGKSARRLSSGRAPRVLLSPCGFRVLAGRTAEQNDDLTFRVAGPEDLWFHAKGYPGAHVIVRTGGTGRVPPEDERFAAALAAAWSRAPEGERVEVHVARRKHLRRPRGGSPGQVLVKKGRTLLATVGPPPASTEGES